MSVDGELEEIIEKRGFVLSINYFENRDELLASDIPVLSVAKFSGDIHDTWLPEDQNGESITPIITNLNTADDTLDVDFTEPLSTTS